MAQLSGSARYSQYTATSNQTTFVEGGDYLASAINAEYDALYATVSELLTQQAQTFKFDPIIPSFTATINAEYDALDVMVSELLTQQAQTFKFDPIIPAFTAAINAEYDALDAMVSELLTQQDQTFKEMPEVKDRIIQNKLDKQAALKGE